MTTRISLVIATYNGESTLVYTLKSLVCIKVPDDAEFSIFIIDNNSSDNTFELLKSSQNKLPLTILREKNKGKNAALNKALQNLDLLGDFIIFSDDDVIFPNDFLERYKIIFETQKNYSLFGGAIIPHWQQSPPVGLLQGIPQTVAFALTNDSDGYSEGAIKAEMIHGPNMAVKKTLFANGFRFNENIGPNGKNYVMGSETDLLIRAQNIGCKAYFSPTIQVEHIIRPYQFDVSWLRNRAFKAGRSLLCVQQRNNKNYLVNTFFGKPRWACRKFMEYRAKEIWFKVIGDKKQFYKYLWLSNHMKGYIFEYSKSNASG